MTLLQLSFLLFFYHVYRVNGNTKLVQNMAVVKSETKTVSINCHFPSDCYSYIHWYQQKEGETLKRILYAAISDGTRYPDANADSFAIDKKGSNMALKIHTAKKEHSAIYYCACWISGGTKHLFVGAEVTVGNRKVFGSGTRLYVTVDVPVPPDLTAYSRSEKHAEKSTMLCQATGMFPDLVKFSWQSESSTGEWTELTSEHFVEQRDEKDKKIFVTSMLIVDKKTAQNNNYNCTVEHEGSTVKKQSATIKQDKVINSENKPEDDNPNPTCPPSENTKQNLETVDQKPSFYLFVYAYGVMIMKNGVYLVTVCIFLLKRKAGKKDESSQEPSK